MSKPVWIGQRSNEERQFILDNTTPAERYRVLFELATLNEELGDYESTTDTTPD